MIRVLLFALLLAPALILQAGEKGSLRVGAARVDITPAKDAALPMSGYAGREEGFKGIRDRLYMRAIVLTDGATEAAVVTCDLSAISNTLWERLSARIEEETGVPRSNVLLAATHTHAGPSLGQFSDDDPNPRVKAYAEHVESRFVEAVRAAKANMKPARIGAGKGTAHVNVNRQARQARGGRWLGINPEGPSDKTLAVVKIESAAGEPVALFMNYGVHCTMLDSRNFDISADLAGAASRFVEKQFGDKVVAPWTSGAGGDQAPIYNRVRNAEEVEIVGRILGEEAMRVAGTLRMYDRARIHAVQRVVTCPGKKSPPGPRRKIPLDYKFEDAGPVDIRLSLLMVNHIALAGVSGEVLTMVGQRLKKESPLAQTIMVTHCNGSSGYIPDEKSFKEFSYETISARVKPGCAEQAIIDAFVEMMERF